MPLAGLSLFVFGGKISSCFLCQKRWAAANGSPRGRSQLRGSPAFCIFPSVFIDGMPGAVIGEGRVLAGGFVPQRTTRISAGCSSAMAQLLAAGQMV